MGSFIGWLDYSESDQRQVRELLKLFSDKGTVDDLGIGTVRDAISNQLFPGTSVVQTRARYFLFIPWIHQEAERRFPTKVIAKAEDMERSLITALGASDDLDGLIGRQAGANLRTLPSMIYWNGLATLGIFTVPGLSRGNYGRLAARRASPGAEHDGELTERSTSFWHREMPAPPEGFFPIAEASFALTKDEASWLSERMLSTEQHGIANLLSCYVRALPLGLPVPTGNFWDDPLPPGTPEHLEELASHAALFSSAVRGAALLYNLMLAEQRGWEIDEELIESLRERLADWAPEASGIRLRDWARTPEQFWSTVVGPGIRIPLATRTFVNEWAEIISSTDLGTLATDERARRAIENRERHHKRAQARFGNPKRLEAWNGESGTTPLSYRWFLVQRFLFDLRDGLARGGVDDARH